MFLEYFYLAARILLRFAFVEKLGLEPMVRKMIRIFSFRKDEYCTANLHATYTVFDEPTRIFKAKRTWSTHFCYFARKSVR